MHTNLFWDAGLCCTRIALRCLIVVKVKSKRLQQASSNARGLRASRTSSTWDRAATPSPKRSAACSKAQIHTIRPELGAGAETRRHRAGAGRPAQEKSKVIFRQRSMDGLTTPRLLPRQLAASCPGSRAHAKVIRLCSGAQRCVATAPPSGCEAPRSQSGRHEPARSYIQRTR